MSAPQRTPTMTVHTMNTAAQSIDNNISSDCNKTSTVVTAVSKNGSKNSSSNHGGVVVRVESNGAAEQQQQQQQQQQQTPVRVRTEIRILYVIKIIR